MSARITPWLRATALGLAASASASNLFAGRTAVRGVARATVSASTAGSLSALPAVVTREPATHPAFELVKVEMVEIDEYVLFC